MGHYDTTIVIVGSGIASSCLLAELLSNVERKIKVIVLERGANEPLSWKLKNRLSVQPHGVVSSLSYRDAVQNRTPHKEWVFNLGLGGGSNAWWGCTPRLLPNDFRMQSVYGVGQDWPVSYQELEEWYCKAEAMLQIAGDSQRTPFPRSKPYPLPPHRLSSVDEALQLAFPDSFFPLPTARASSASAGRGRCCASGVCFLCPVGAKFTVTHDLAAIYSDPRVELRTGVEALSLQSDSTSVHSIRARSQRGDEVIKGDLFCLGANPIFNSAILLRSGFTHPQLGVGLCEQRSVFFRTRLRRLRGFDGGTSITGHHYGWYDTEHRSKNAACLIETWNVPRVALEGNPRALFEFKAIFEDLPHSQSRVTVEDDERPCISFFGETEYLRAGVEHFFRSCGPLLEALEVETISPQNHSQGLAALSRTEGHILGGTIMGRDPAHSIVDQHMRHHTLKNLYVLGGGGFPTISPANPTLTIAALSLRTGATLL